LDEKNNLLGKIQKETLPSMRMEDILSGWLVHHGYAKTLEALDGKIEAGIDLRRSTILLT
jgi:hypothetical protein